MNNSAKLLCIALVFCVSRQAGAMDLEEGITRYHYGQSVADEFRQSPFLSDSCLTVGAICCTLPHPLATAFGALLCASGCYLKHRSRVHYSESSSGSLYTSTGDEEESEELINMADLRAREPHRSLHMD